MSFFKNMKENIYAAINHSVKENTNPAHVAEWRLEKANRAYSDAVNRAAVATAERRAAERTVERLESQIRNIEERLKGKLMAQGKDSDEVRRLAKEKILVQDNLTASRDTLRSLREGEERLLDMVTELSIARQQLRNAAVSTINTYGMARNQRSINEMRTDSGLTAMSSMDTLEDAQKMLDTENARAAIIGDTSLVDDMNERIEKELAALSA